MANADTAFAWFEALPDDGVCAALKLVRPDLSCDAAWGWLEGLPDGEYESVVVRAYNLWFARALASAVKRAAPAPSGQPVRMVVLPPSQWQRPARSTPSTSQADTTVPSGWLAATIGVAIGVVAVKVLA